MTFLRWNKKKWGNFKTSHGIVIFCLAMLSAKLFLLHLESMDSSVLGIELNLVWVHGSTLVAGTGLFLVL